MIAKTDEKKLLAFVQHGESIEVAAIACRMDLSRLSYVLKKWRQVGMIDAAGNLTPKGRQANGGAPANIPPLCAPAVLSKAEKETPNDADVHRLQVEDLDPTPHDQTGRDDPRPFGD